MVSVGRECDGHLRLRGGYPSFPLCVWLWGRAGVLFLYARVRLKVSSFSSGCGCELT